MVDTAAVNITHQTLFRSEYELEMEHWLRRRFRAVCICYAVLGALVLLFRMLEMMAGAAAIPATAIVVNIVAGLASVGTALYLLYGRHWAYASRPEMLHGVTIMILMLGGISALKALILSLATPGHGADFLVPLFFWHLIACLFLPWTPRESLRPILPLLALWMLGVLFFDNIAWWAKLLKVIFVPGVLIPGLLICAFRLQQHGEKFRTRMIGKHFLSMRNELQQARNIHESMFPKPHDDGHVRFDYTYRPMRDLGGDYVHLHVSDDGVVHLTVIDVTGHGLAAALTVNRLFGELARIRAECPLAEPGEVLTLLNRYIHFTMSRHNIFATAMVITLDPSTSKLHWANAGHPPAFLRGANGHVTNLPATAVLLGALEPKDFDAGAKTIDLTPGDAIVVYTDGAFEARDRSGRALGLERLAEVMQSRPSPLHWPQFVASAVERHSAGRADDDVLIASLMFRAPRFDRLTERQEATVS